MQLSIVTHHFSRSSKFSTKTGIKSTCVIMQQGKTDGEYTFKPVPNKHSNTNLCRSLSLEMNTSFAE